MSGKLAQAESSTPSMSVALFIIMRGLPPEAPSTRPPAHERCQQDRGEANGPTSHDQPAFKVRRHALWIAALSATHLAMIA